MKTIIFAALTFFLLLSANALAANNELNHYEELAGWQLLFDGKTTDGWRNYQSDDVSSGWSVEGGTLKATKKAGDLITKEKYDNFELRLEYKISKGGNSGLIFHVTEDNKKAWHSGPEVQILDDENNTKTKEKSGYLYGLYKPNRPGWSVSTRAAAGLPNEDISGARPHTEWNELYLLVSKSNGIVALNGVPYFKFRMGTKDWDKRVAATKFSKFPEFAKSGTGHICLQEHGSDIAFRNIRLRKLDDRGAPLKQPITGKLEITGEPAFPNLDWDGWDPVDERGRNKPLRFMELTHAENADGHRMYAAAQKGQIFSFKNDPKTTESKLFLDITEQVQPWWGRGSNEEGLLGLAFHPKFKQNGHFFVYYSVRNDGPKSRVSRFTVPAGSDVADPDSELVVIEIEQPFKNHNGGSMGFGPDGFLYIGMGDGGDMNDPFGNGQDLSTLLGSVLRIDIDNKENGKNYAIPKDNPFIALKGAKPEIYAHGFRNIWRLAFDSTRGDLWLADVGQDLWEEVNLVRSGGNYGWSTNEGNHPFGKKVRSGKQPTGPVWAYDHCSGRSITGGRVYNGTRIPGLNGKYVYADYVTGRIWALDYDHDTGKVNDNFQIADGGITVTSFGEDENGEVYYMIAAANGQCIYRFKPAE